MLSEERIKEAEKNIKSYLSDGLIKKGIVIRGESIFLEVIKNAK